MQYFTIKIDNEPTCVAKQVKVIVWLKYFGKYSEHREKWQNSRNKLYKYRCSEDKNKQQIMTISLSREMKFMFYFGHDDELHGYKMKTSINSQQMFSSKKKTRFFTEHFKHDDGFHSKVLLEKPFPMPIWLVYILIVYTSQQALHPK